VDLSRRDFLYSLPAGAGLAAALPMTKAASGPRFGCQTNAWAIKPNDFGSFLEVLGKIKNLGFEAFETSFRNVQSEYSKAESARGQFAKIGLACFGVHIFLNEYDPETLIPTFDFIKTTADGAAALGAERLIVSGAGVARDGKVEEARLGKKIAGLNAAGKFCRDKGLKFAYHNHGPEVIAGGVEIDALMTRTDPALVDFLVDCGHAYRAGVNLAEFFTRHRKRIAGLHLRDFKGEAQVPLGLGEVDWKPLAAAVKKASWDGWILAEEERADGSKPGESAAGPARETLRKLFGR
jgi:inosose dehydratase